MDKARLSAVTLFGLDCVDIARLIQAAEICTKELEFERVVLLSSLPSGHPHVRAIDPVDSIEAYNDFMIRRLDSYLETEFVMTIQFDAFVLNPAAWSEEFLHYDYIGAPWWEGGKYVVGNGGFSIRSKRLLELLRTDSSIKRPAGVPEDWFICVDIRDHLEHRGMRFAPVEVARRFSFEANERDGVVWTDQFGFHGLDWTDISRWTREHPEYRIENALDAWALERKRRRPSDEYS